MKKTIQTIIAIVFAIIMVTGCASEYSMTEQGTEAAAAVTTSVSETTSETITVNSIEEAAALVGNWDDSILDAEEVFDYSKKDSADYSSEDADQTIILDNETVEIIEAGTYLLSGTIDDGQVIVNATSEDDIILILDGVNITAVDAAPIHVEQADKVIIVLAEGSENYLEDAAGSASSDESTGAAVIYSRDDLTITGSGSLNVTANRDNGIQTKDDLVIYDGTITIVSADDGLVGKDSVVIHDGDISIESAGDGIKATNEEVGEEGYVAIEGGIISLAVNGEGIQSSGSILVAGGDIAVITGSGSSSSSISQKGLKAQSDLTVTGGNLTIYASDDAVHSDSSVHISGGEFFLVAVDDGIHADEALIIEDGMITIAQAYEGLESENIFIMGGTTDIVSSDDGLNATGETSGTFSRGEESGDFRVLITAGTLSVNAGGDGLDSNGDLYMNGGDVTIVGPTTERDGSIDYNGTFVISGGTLATAGSSGMMQMPSDSSSQNSILITFDTAETAGTTVDLLDEGGTVLASVTPEINFETVLFSLPVIDGDEDYTIVTDSGIMTAFTASDTNTSIGESGQTVTLMEMGGGKPGRGTKTKI